MPCPYEEKRRARLSRAIRVLQRGDKICVEERKYEHSSIITGITGIPGIPGGRVRIGAGHCRGRGAGTRRAIATGAAIFASAAIAGAARAKRELRRHVAH